MSTPAAPAPAPAPNLLHAHPHDAHGHGHAHAHGHAPAPPAATGWRAPPSLLMAGVGARLLGVGGLLVLLWAAVAWALGEPA